MVNHPNRSQRTIDIPLTRAEINALAKLLTQASAAMPPDYNDFTRWRHIYEKLSRILEDLEGTA